MQLVSPATRRVLVIDDDPELIALLTDGLSLLGGYEVVEANNGASGLERFYAVRPDCVVVDVRMPGLDGYQFVRALRGDRETAQTPILALSALVQDHEQLAGLLSGADAYLQKPVRMHDLLAALEHAMLLTADDRLNRQRSLANESDEGDK
jgi:two-component system alkaline phosphatase synthesis response regulator PhoP